MDWLALSASLSIKLASSIDRDVNGGPVGRIQLSSEISDFTFRFSEFFYHVNLRHLLLSTFVNKKKDDATVTMFQGSMQMITLN